MHKILSSVFCVGTEIYEMYLDLHRVYGNTLLSGFYLLGVKECLDVLTPRFERILGVGVSLAASMIIEEGFQMATVIAANINPFKWLFGGPDSGVLSEALDNLLATVKDLVMLAKLLGRLTEFLNHADLVVRKMQDNMRQIKELDNLIKLLADETDPDIVAEHADNYVKVYSEYTPQVTEKDIMYVTTLLAAVASESCSIVGEFTGTIDSILGIGFEEATLDCQFIESDIAILEYLFTDTYTLQFELVDTLTSIVKGTIAKGNAGQSTCIVDFM